MKWKRCHKNTLLKKDQTNCKQDEESGDETL